MAIPLIPVAVGGAIGAGGALLGGLFNRGKQEDERIIQTYEYSPTDIFTYSPTDARQTIDARQDARSVVYQPVIQIESPGATGTPTSRIEQDLYSRPQQEQRVNPEIVIMPSQERSITQDTAGAGISNQTLIITAGIIGAVLLIPQLTK